MYVINEILNKLNASYHKNDGLKKSFPNGKVTLPDIMVRSFAEVKELAGDALTWGEKNFLYQQAQNELKKIKWWNPAFLAVRTLSLRTPCDWVSGSRPCCIAMTTGSRSVQIAS